MFDESDIRVLLREADVPPSRVEVSGVLRDGKRRVRRRQLAATGAAVALAATVTAVIVVPSALGSTGGEPSQLAHRASAVPSAAPTASLSPVLRSCPAQRLAVPARYDIVQAMTTDPTGQYIGGHAIVGQNFVPIVWIEGVPTVLPVEADSANVIAINKDGVVVGLASRAGKSFAYRYEKGTVTRLRTPPGDWHVYPAPAINASGDVVMNAEPQGSSGGQNSVVLMWRAGSDVAEILPLPAEKAGVYAITDDGNIVGGMYENGVGVDAYVWDPKGHGRKLRKPAGTTALAHAARGDWATGGAWFGDDATTILWDLRTGAMTDLKVVGPAWSVNSSGWVISGGGELYIDGVPADLQPLTVGRTVRAEAVADDGTVVGASFGSGGESTPVTWHC